MGPCASLGNLGVHSDACTLLDILVTLWGTLRIPAPYLGKLFQFGAPQHSNGTMQHSAKQNVRTRKKGEGKRGRKNGGGIEIKRNKKK